MGNGSDIPGFFDDVTSVLHDVQGDVTAGKNIVTGLFGGTTGSPVQGPPTGEQMANNMKWVMWAALAGGVVLLFLAVRHRR